MHKLRLWNYYYLEFQTLRTFQFYQREGRRIKKYIKYRQIKLFCLSQQTGFYLLFGFLCLKSSPFSLNFISFHLLFLFLFVFVCLSFFYFCLSFFCFCLSFFCFCLSFFLSLFLFFLSLFLLFLSPFLLFMSLFLLFLCLFLFVSVSLSFVSVSLSSYISLSLYLSPYISLLHMPFQSM